MACGNFTRELTNTQKTIDSIPLQEYINELIKLRQKIDKHLENISSNIDVNKFKNSSKRRVHRILEIEKELNEMSELILKDNIYS